MPRVMIVTGTPAWKKGTVVELSAAEVTALGSAVRPVIYRDQLAEGTAVSNSSA
jgi:hypothetical protein